MNIKSFLDQCGDAKKQQFLSQVPNALDATSRGINKVAIVHGDKVFYVFWIPAHDAPAYNPQYKRVQNDGEFIASWNTDGDLVAVVNHDDLIGIDHLSVSQRKGKDGVTLTYKCDGGVPFMNDGKIVMLSDGDHIWDRFFPYSDCGDSRFGGHFD